MLPASCRRRFKPFPVSPANVLVPLQSQMQVRDHADRSLTTKSLITEYSSEYMRHHVLPAELSRSISTRFNFDVSKDVLTHNAGIDVWETHTK